MAICRIVTETGVLTSP